MKKKYHLYAANVEEFLSVHVGSDQRKTCRASHNSFPEEWISRSRGNSGNMKFLLEKVYIDMNGQERKQEGCGKSHNLTRYLRVRWQWRPFWGDPDRSGEHVLGSWRKGDSCYQVSKNLAELCSRFSVLSRFPLLSWSCTSSLRLSCALPVAARMTFPNWTVRLSASESGATLSST